MRSSSSAAASTLPLTGSARNAASYSPRSSACSTPHTSSTESDESARARATAPAETLTAETGARQVDKPGAEKLQTDTRHDGTKKDVMERAITSNKRRDGTVNSVDSGGCLAWLDIRCRVHGLLFTVFSAGCPGSFLLRKKKHGFKNRSAPKDPKFPLFSYGSTS